MWDLRMNFSRDRDDVKGLKRTGMPKDKTTVSNRMQSQMIQMFVLGSSVCIAESVWHLNYKQKMNELCDQETGETT